MKRIIAILVALSCLTAAFPGIVMADAAIGGGYNYQDVDFYVVVDAPDGYVNFRYGPGMEYGINYPIYNGEVLHVFSTADNYYDGLWWGQTEYGGDWGWISLSQTSMIDNPYIEPETWVQETETWAQETETWAQEPDTAASVPEGQEDQSHADVIRGFRNTGYLVEDAYYSETGDRVISIPMVNLGSAEILALNQEIYQTYYPEIQNALSHPDEVEILTESTYIWNVNGDILSLVIHSFYGGPWFQYMVYNISVSEQTVLSKHDVISAAGWSNEEYQEQLRAVMMQSFLDVNSSAASSSNSDMRAQYDIQQERTLGDDNMEEALPFLNGEGSLCVIGRIYIPMAQLPYSLQELDLQQDAADTEDSFYVRVNSRNSAFLRQQAGSSAQSLLPIPYGQKLCITKTVTDYDTYDIWGRTFYNGQQGWVLLSDTVDCR